MRTLNALSKGKEAILYLCRRCDEQGFYSPGRQKLVEEALLKLTEEIDLLMKEGQIDIEPFVKVGSMHIDTLQSHLQKTSDLDPSPIWAHRRAVYDESYISLYAIKNDLEQE